MKQLQIFLIVLAIVLFVWDSVNKQVNVKLESLAWAALTGAYLASWL